MTRIVETQLVSSAGRLDKLPPAALPEVAFAGRSNVGKSSLLNALANRKQLFKVSQTPGRTRTIVHVKARLDTGAEIHLVDLPGFGFAKVSRGAKQAWGRLIESYLTERETLHGVFLLVDIRRGLQDDELDLLQFLEQAGTPAYVVATKVDRIARSKQHAVLTKLKAEFDSQIIPTSAKTRYGLDNLLLVLLKACGY